MTDEETPRAARIATGAAAGLIAGLVGSLAMDRFQAVAQPSPKGDGEPATQRAADAISVVAMGAPLAKDGKPMGGHFVHYGLGAMLGVAYGVAAEFAPRVTSGGGTAFAAGTWALLDETAVPAAGLGEPPWKAPPASQAFGLASHIVFGLTAELTRRVAHHALSSISHARDAL